MYRRTNRGLLVLIIVIIIIIAAGVYFYATQSSRQNVPTGMNNSTNQSIGNNSSTIASNPNTISIQNATFSPNNLTVRSGTNIQWINNDNKQHQIASDSGAFQSPVLNPGDSYNFYFAKSGIYGYHDALNSTITGTITVQ